MLKEIEERARLLRWHGCNWDESFHYAFMIGGNDMATLRRYEFETTKGGIEDAGTEVDRRVKEYQQQKPGVGYGEAMKIILSEDADLKKRYTEVQNG